MTVVNVADTARAPDVDDAAIRLRGAGKRFSTRRNSVEALRPLDLDIGAGSFTVIVGRSGCGKSTLLRMIAGLSEPTSGSVVVNGSTVRGPAPGTRYVFQDYGSSLLPWRTVRQNVAFGIKHGAGEETGSADDYLDLVGLSEAGDRHPWELSGGMQQRTAIARALASGSRIVLLDEPFSAVDALSRARLQDVVQRLWAELGLTVVLVTHDIDEAVYLADRVIVLGPGGEGIRADVEIDLDRPRHQVDTRESPAFLAHRRALADELFDGGTV